MLKQVQSNWIQPFPAGRLNAEQAAKCINCNAKDIRALVLAGLLAELGHPSASSVKYFATVELERLCADPAWLGRATDAIYEQWRLKNGTKVAKTRPASQKKNRRRYGKSTPMDTPYYVHTDLPEA